MPVGAAVGAGLGALGSLGSAWIQKQGAKNASQAQTAMLNQSMQMQRQFGQQGMDFLTGLVNRGYSTSLPLLEESKAYLRSGLPAAGDLMTAGKNVLNTGGDIMGAGMGYLYGPAADALARGYNVLDTGTGMVGAGANAFGAAYNPLMRLLTPGADATKALSEMPGFKFAQDWGQQAVRNQGTTMGLGGNVLKSGAEFATGLASQRYGDIVNQLQQASQLGLGYMGQGIGYAGLAPGILGTGVNLGNIGAGLVGTGAGLTQTGGGLMTAGAGNLADILKAISSGNISVGNNVLSSLASAGAAGFGGLNALGQNVGNTMSGIGQSQAQGIMGQSNALAGGFGGAANSLGNMALMYSLMSGGFGGGAGGPATSPIPGVTNPGMSQW